MPFPPWIPRSPGILLSVLVHAVVLLAVPIPEPPPEQQTDVVVELQQSPRESPANQPTDPVVRTQRAPEPAERTRHQPPSPSDREPDRARAREETNNKPPSGPPVPHRPGDISAPSTPGVRTASRTSSQSEPSPSHSPSVNPEKTSSPGVKKTARTAPDDSSRQEQHPRPPSPPEPSPETSRSSTSVPPVEATKATKRTGVESETTRHRVRPDTGSNSVEPPPTHIAAASEAPSRSNHAPEPLNTPTGGSVEVPPSRVASRSPSTPDEDPNPGKSTPVVEPSLSSSASPDHARKQSRREFQRSVRSRIEKAKTYPSALRKDKIEGTVVVQFTIHPDGSVSSVDCSKCSPSDRLNEAARRAIERAAPFPNVPVNETLTYRIQLRYRLR